MADMANAGGTTPMQQLLYRNAELETELRLVKVQLDEAHTTTRYLLRHLSSQAPADLPTHHEGLQTQLDGALGEFRLLKQQLTTISNDHTKSISSANGADRSGHATDLIDFENDDTAGEIPAHGSRVASQSAYNSETGAAATDDAPLRQTDRVLDAKAFHLPPNALHGETNFQDVEDADCPWVRSRFRSREEMSAYVDHFAGPPTGPDQSPSNKTRSLYFNPLARNALVANAAFLEDQDDTERMQSFFNLSRRFPEHVPLEFKWHYERDIRPLYKVQQRRAETWRQESRVTSPMDSHTDKIETQPASSSGGVGSEAPETVTMDEEICTSGSTLITDGSIRTLRTDSLEDSHISQAARDSKRNSSLGNSEDSSTDEREMLRLHNSKSMERRDKASSVMLGTSVHQAYASMAETVQRFQDTANASSTISPVYVHRTPDQYRKFSPYGASNDQWTGPREVEQLFFAPREPTPKLRRTVVITNVSPGISLAQIMDRVHGGPILSATFLNTYGFRTKPSTGRTNGALIVFAFGESAENFYKDCRAGNWLMFWFAGFAPANIKARIELIESPTRPAPVGLLQALKERKVSRVLYVNDGRRFEPDEVASEIVRYSNSNRSYDKVPQPLKATRDSDGIIVLEYASVVFAQRALIVLQQDYWFFQNVECGFLTDPCDQLLSRCKNVSKEEIAAKEAAQRPDYWDRFGPVYDQDEEDASDTSTCSFQDTISGNGDSMPRIVATEMLKTSATEMTGLEQQAALIEV